MYMVTPNAGKFLAHDYALSPNILYSKPSSGVTLREDYYAVIRVFILCLHYRRHLAGTWLHLAPRVLILSPLREEPCRHMITLYP